MSDKLDFEKPPKDDVFRAATMALALTKRADLVGPAYDEPVETDEEAQILRGHFARFDSPTEIDSWFEGNFMEVIEPGSFRKTFKEGRADMRVLLQHGYDPQLGDKPIAVIQELREDDEGAYYEAEILDGLDPLVIAGIRGGQYGASFRFKVMREAWEEEPGVSDWNPKGLPVRRIKEVQVREFGPVTWGAYPDATSELAGAGLRSLEPGQSLVEDWIVERMAADPERLEHVVTARANQAAAFGRASEIIRVAGLNQTTSPPNGDGTAPDDEALQVDPSRREDDPEAKGVQDPPAPAEGAEIPDATRKDYLSEEAMTPPWHLS